MHLWQALITESTSHGCQAVLGCSTRVTMMASGKQLLPHHPGFLDSPERLAPASPRLSVPSIYLPSGPVLSRLLPLSEGLQTAKSRDGVCFVFGWHSLLGQVFPRVWVVRGSPNSRGHAMPGPKRHTINDISGEIHFYQVQYKWHRSLVLACSCLYLPSHL